jgi:PEP-CTERM motif
MKKLILTAMGVACLTISGYSQGLVQFANFSGTGGGKVFTGGALATGSTTLELLYGPAGDTLAELIALGTGQVFTYNISTTPSLQGEFFYGTVTTAQPAGGGSADATLNVELAIAGWTGNFSNYAAALAGNAPTIGITAAFGNPTGGGGSPPSTAATLVNWTSGNNLVLAASPEPTTLALGGLGAAALLMFRRRK